MLVSSIKIYSQQTTVTIPPTTKADYLKKSRSQKAGAWVLLGGGFLVLGITAASNAGVYIQDPKPFPVVPVCIGGAMMAGSIPLFIAAGKNKRRATEISFRKELIPYIQKNSFVNHSVPSLALSIKI